MGMDANYDSHSDTVAKVLPAVQHSVDILSVRQTHTHTFWIISVARALAIIVLGRLRTSPDHVAAAIALGFPAPKRHDERKQQV